MADKIVSWGGFDSKGTDGMGVTGSLSVLGNNIIQSGSLFFTTSSFTTNTRIYRERDGSNEGLVFRSAGTSGGYASKFQFLTGFNGTDTGANALTLTGTNTGLTYNAHFGSPSGSNRMTGTALVGISTYSTSSDSLWIFNNFNITNPRSYIKFSNVGYGVGIPAIGTYIRHQGIANNYGGHSLVFGVNNDSGATNETDILTVNLTGLGVRTNSPSATIHVVGSGATSSTTALLVQNANASASLSVLDNSRVVIGTETVSQGSLYIGHNGTSGGSNGTSTLFFASQFGGNYPYRLGAEGNGYDFYLRQISGGQGSINIDFSGLNRISYNITNTNILNQSFSTSSIIVTKSTLNSYLAIGNITSLSNSQTDGDTPLIFFRSMGGSYFDKTIDAAVTIRNGLPTVAEDNITKNTAFWYRNGYIGIGTSTSLFATNTLQGALTINQGTNTGYVNRFPTTASLVNTSGLSTTVTFTPDNGNTAPSYNIIVGTIITANSASRKVTAVRYNNVTVDTAVDWSGGYPYTYRNPYVSIADGSRPIFDINPSGNVGIGTSTPNYTLDVSGSSEFVGSMLITGSVIISGSATTGEGGYNTVPSTLYVKNSIAVFTDLDNTASINLKGSSTNRGMKGIYFYHNNRTAWIESVPAGASDLGGLRFGAGGNTVLDFGALGYTAGFSVPVTATSYGGSAVNGGTHYYNFNSSEFAVRIASTRLGSSGRGNLKFQLKVAGGDASDSDTFFYVPGTNKNISINSATTDLGATLGVKGSGTTSSTTSLLVQNANASASLSVKDGIEATSQTTGKFQVIAGNWIDTASYTATIWRTGSLASAKDIIIGSDGTLNGYSSRLNFVNYYSNNGQGAQSNFSGYLRTSIQNYRPNGTGQPSGRGTLLLGIYDTDYDTVTLNSFDVVSIGKYDTTISGSATISNVLTLTPQSPLPSGVPTGSFAVSSSVPPKPYFYDGTIWNALY